MTDLDKASAIIFRHLIRGNNYWFISANYTELVISYCYGNTLDSGATSAYVKQYETRERLDFVFKKTADRWQRVFNAEDVNFEFFLHLVPDLSNHRFDEYTPCKI